MKFPLTECPFINPILIEEAKKSLPPDVYKQEFEAEFVDSGNDVFIGIDKVSVVNSFNISKTEVYVGIDTGLTDDKSVLTLIDTTGRVRYVDHCNNDSIQSISKRFINIMNKFIVVGGYIETNGIGRAMYDLIKPSFPRIKAFNTTQDNKMEMVRKLIGDIESLNIELPTVDLLPELHQEFTSYTYKMSNNGKLSFTHLPGQHDDFIDSLMLSNFSRVQFIKRNKFNLKVHQKQKTQSMELPK